MSEGAKSVLAIALAYEKGEGAPTVVATGRGYVAKKIIETAEKHGVPLESDPALAQALSSVELGDEIPKELYVAVSEIIGFIFRASGRLR